MLDGNDSSEKRSFEDDTVEGFVKALEKPPGWFYECQMLMMESSRPENFPLTGKDPAHIHQ